jgi:hypothetical protein
MAYCDSLSSIFLISNHQPWAIVLSIGSFYFDDLP